MVTTYKFRPQLVSKKFLLKESIQNKNWIKRMDSHSYGIPNLDHAARMCGYLHTRGSHGYDHKKWSKIERRWMRIHNNIMEKL